MRGTLHHHGEQHTLRFERRLAHSPERVWRAISEPAELSHWFPADVRGERKQGAPLRFVFPHEAAPLEADLPETSWRNGQMLVYDPPRIMELSWAGEIIRMELQPDQDGTRLIFTHTFPDRRKAARDACGWEYCLGSLERNLAGLPQEPFNPKRFDNVFDEYAVLFGPEASILRGPEAS
ncbi:MAG: SRPBCC family protein [Bryobacteraceae bacterium]